MSPATPPSPPVRLVTLGRLALLGADGEDRDLARRRRKLALLALLALSPRPIARDVLVDVFWGEDDEVRARHSLADALSHLRRVLGRDAIATRASDVALAPDAPLLVDAREFADACAAREWARAVALYEGPFLDGVFIDRAPRFDDWAMRERDRLRRLFVRACEGECAERAARGDWEGCAALAQRWLDAAPTSGEAAHALMTARAAPGTPEALREALEVHARLAARLDADYEAAPQPEVDALARDLATRLASRRTAEPSGAAPQAAPAAAAETRAPAVAGTWMARDRVAGRWRRLGIAAAVLLGSLGAVAAFRLGAGRTPAARTWIVVADAENATRDSVFDRSLTVALGAALAESPTVDVLPTARVREVSRRMRRPDGAPLDEAAAIEVAQRVGAGAVVVPSVARVGGRVMLSARLVAASPREYPDAPAAAPRPALASARAEAGGDTDVLPALDRLARQLRRALGESYLAVHGAVPLPLATTASLPALKAYAEGNRAYDAGRAGDAVNAWHLALAYDSTFALVHTQLGAHLAWINQPAEAETHFVQALRHAERLPPRERLLVEAGVATWRGDRQRAIALEEGWLVDHPNDRGVLGRLAYAYLRARRFADARDAYDRLLRVDSLDATSQINLATALSALGTPADLRRAQSAYARAFALDSVLARDVDLLHEYAQMLVASGRPDSAAGVFRAMLGREPTARARGQRGLAFLALARGRPGEAAAAFREAVRIHHAISDNVLSELRVRLFRAAALDESGAPAAAAAERDTALGLALARPIEPAMLVHVGRALTRGGRVADARVVRDSLRARVRPGSQPDSAALLLLDAELAVAAGRAEEGERFAAAAYRVEPSASALETLARAAWRRGDLAGAAARYTQLAALSKFGSEEAEGPRRALYWLGLVEEARGDHAAARRAWGAFVARFPEPGSDGITLADARWRLAAR